MHTGVSLFAARAVYNKKVKLANYSKSHFELLNVKEPEQNQSQLLKGSRTEAKPAANSYRSDRRLTIRCMKLWQN